MTAVLLHKVCTAAARVQYVMEVAPTNGWRPVWEAPVIAVVVVRAPACDFALHGAVPPCPAGALLAASSILTERPCC